MTDAPTVMVIEDNQLVREALVKTISQFGMEVYSSGSADRAIDTWRMVRPQTVVLDWELGDMLSGVDIANQLYNEGITTRIVFITGKSVTNLRELTSHLRVAAYLKKPFRLHELKSALLHNQ